MLRLLWEDPGEGERVVVDDLRCFFAETSAGFGASLFEPKLVFAAAPILAAAFWPTCAPPPPASELANLEQISEQRMKHACDGWRCPSCR